MDQGPVDPSLLTTIDVNKSVSRNFNLKMSEFVTADAFDENEEPGSHSEKKGKSRLSFSLNKSRRSASSNVVSAPSAKKPRKALQPKNGRISESEYSSMAVPHVPKKNNQWARKNFILWRDALRILTTNVLKIFSTNSHSMSRR